MIVKHLFADNCLFEARVITIYGPEVNWAKSNTKACDREYHLPVFVHDPMVFLLRILSSLVLSLDDICEVGVNLFERETAKAAWNLGGYPLVG